MKRSPEPSRHIQPLLLTRDESAFVLGISVRAIDYLIAGRQLSTRKIGRRRLIPYASLARFARQDHPDIGSAYKTSSDEPASGNPNPSVPPENASFARDDDQTPPTPGHSGDRDDDRGHDVDSN
jgi:hypothetical protein